jgi:RNA polymerase-interacting CarD/CdnL/TRCF family regulator
MSTELTYEVGDWIVHNAYGVGQIKKVETKPIHGEKVKTFRVRTKDSVYWLPVEEADTSRIRRVVNKRKLRRALRAVKSKPKEMAKNYKTRNATIKDVFLDGSFMKMAKLLRDLLALQKRKKWNMTETNAVERIKQRFSREYAVCYEVPIEEGRQKISELIIEVSNDE